MQPTPPTAWSYQASPSYFGASEPFGFQASPPAAAFASPSFYHPTVAAAGGISPAYSSATERHQHYPYPQPPQTPHHHQLQHQGQRAYAYAATPLYDHRHDPYLTDMGLTEGHPMHQSHHHSVGYASELRPYPTRYDGMPEPNSDLRDPATHYPDYGTLVDPWTGAPRVMMMVPPFADDAPDHGAGAAHGSSGNSSPNTRFPPLQLNVSASYRHSGKTTQPPTPSGRERAAVAAKTPFQVEQQQVSTAAAFAQPTANASPVDDPWLECNTADVIELPRVAPVAAATRQPQQQHQQVALQSALKSPRSPNVRRRDSPQVQLPPSTPTANAAGGGGGSSRGGSAGSGNLTTDVSFGNPTGGAAVQTDAEPTSATAMVPALPLPSSGLPGQSRLVTAWSMASVPSVDFSINDHSGSRRDSAKPPSKQPSTDDLAIVPPSASLPASPRGPKSTSSSVASPPTAATTSAAADKPATSVTADDSALKKVLLRSIQVRRARQEAIVSQPASEAPPTDLARPSSPLDPLSSASAEAPSRQVDDASAAQANNPPIVEFVDDPFAAFEERSETPGGLSGEKKFKVQRRRRGSGFVVQALDPATFVRNPFVASRDPLSVTAAANGRGMGDDAVGSTPAFTCISVQAATERYGALPVADAADARVRRECLDINLQPIPITSAQLSTSDANGARSKTLRAVIVVVVLVAIAGIVVGVLYWQGKLKFV